MATGKNKAGRSAGNPVFTRFRSVKRGWYSLLALAALYVVSLGAEFVANDRPLWMRFNGKHYFPVFNSYSQNDFLGDGNGVKITDYRTFLAGQTNAVVKKVMAPFESGKHQTFSAADIRPYLRYDVEFVPDVKTAAYQVNNWGEIIYSYGDTDYFEGDDEWSLSDKFNYFFNGAYQLADDEDDEWNFREALHERFMSQNEIGDLYEEWLEEPSSGRKDKKQILPAIEMTTLNGIVLRLAPFTPRGEPIESVRIFVRENNPHKPWKGRATASRLAETIAKAARRDAVALPNPDETGWIEPVKVEGGTINIVLEPAAFPFRPVPGHPMGFDGSGRDVLARILYGMRISMTFGLILISVTLFVGTCAGAVQGYFAGWVDITGQRFTEIWSALPFLYVIILMGNTFGRSFGLLLGCYAAFNWIGSAAYMRAEFLRLRTRAFVDAAKCQGLSGARIMFAHILPNALTPIITLLPFALVGAIGALSSLDYLGYGMPAGTPSWGELIQQAQAYRYAWWLILYPSLAIFTVMLLGVFVGEALRAAADPRPYSKME